MRLADQLVDVALLNLLWLVCCLPIITIGASTVAAYRVSMRMIDSEEGYIVKSFFKAFRANFVQGTFLWLLNAAALYALYLDWQIVSKSSDPSIILILVSILSTVFIFCVFIYSYPLTARYENTLKKMLENSLIMSVRYFVKTLILILVLALEVALFMWNLPMQIAGVIIGPMILIYTVSGISKGIFQKIDSDNASNGEQ
jgi:uncharacterized membrane protein YesL